MDEFELLVDLHLNTERQGPGSFQDTLRALRLCDFDKERELNVADIGCGTGAQTFTLASELKGSITAVDLFDEFLNQLEERKRNHALRCEIATLKASMDDLPFAKESLDLIWSEGAIYNMGFEKGVNYWSQFLKPGGFLAVSEITWTTSNRPKEIDDFWNEAYPEITVASEKIRVLESSGYSLRGYFVLPERSWIDNYYRPLENQFEPFLHRHGNSSEAFEIVEENKSEIALYEKFKNYYSYGFYIAQKVA